MTLPAELMAFVREEHARRAILDMFFRWGHAMDDQAAEDWVDCFTPDGVFSLVRAGEAEPLIDLRGHDQLRTWFEQRTRSVPATSNHVVLNPLFEWRGERRAEVVSYHVGVSSPSGEVIVSAGRYRDVVVVCEDGSWRLEERRAFGRVGNPPVVPLPG